MKTRYGFLRWAPVLLALLVLSTPLCLAGVCGDNVVDPACNCCTGGDAVGCDDDTCEAAVCAVDSFCCNNDWDAICSGEAASLCTCCDGEECDDGNTVPGDGCDENCMSEAPTNCGDGVLDPACDCCSGGNGMGCNDSDCETAVCTADSFCCNTTWDTVCDDQAATLCTCCVGEECDDGNTIPGDGCDEDCLIELCGNGILDCNCCAGGDDPFGCNDEDCETTVCTADPFCCNTDWDTVCDGEAAMLCTCCGNEQCDDGNTDPGDGCDGDCLFECGNGVIDGCNCCSGGDGQGCDDASCEAAVCGADSYCCDVEWDFICNDEAQTLCTCCLEECDDGNAILGDGCNASCLLECGDGTPIVELIVNGDFETGGDPWFIDDLGGTGFFDIFAPGADVDGFPTAPNPDGGTFCAVSTATGSGVRGLFQVFAVPAGLLSAELSFQMFVNDESGAGPVVNPVGLDHTAGANQHARVDILTGIGGFDTTTTVVANYYLDVDPGPLPNSYTNYSIDITNDVMVGGIFTIRFAEVDTEGPLHLGLDNVSILVQSEQCDDGNQFDDDCCSSTCDAAAAAGAVCRASVDSCDEAEVCNDSGDACPADVLTSDINQSDRTDGFDVVIIGQALGSTSVDPEFVPEADLVVDGVIDGMDVDKLTQTFGCEPLP